MRMKTQPTVIDIFSGCGGISWGLHKLGFKVLAAIDNWKVALKTFELNHPDSKVYCWDIRELDPLKILKEVGLKPEELDCIVGGPPCQGFSKNVRASSRFLEDPRNQLFREYLRFVRLMKPKTIVMENVAEIYNAFSGTVREEVIKTLGELGYKVDVRVLYAPDYGVPQRRRRCFFFASRVGSQPVLPSPTHQPTSEGQLFRLPEYNSAWSAISDLPSLKNGEGEDGIKYPTKPQNDFQKKMRRESKVIRNHIARKLSDIQFRRLSSIGPGQAIKDLPEEIRPKGGYSGAYGRLDYEMIAPTITRWVFHPGSGRYGHPTDIRTITMREAARLQSFSDDFQFVGSYTDIAGQIGNAVPPLMMEAVAQSVLSCLSAKESR